MKTRSIIFSVLAAVAFVACGQTTEEKIAEFDAAVEVMENEYYAMRDSIGSDMEAWNAYYNTFMDEYKAFNLTNAQENHDNEIALKALLNLRGLISDEESASILNSLSEDMLQNEKVQSLKKGLDARLATAEGKMFVDFTVNSVIGHTRSIPAQPIYSEVKLSDYVGKGKYILLDFWSPWCGPCRREMPNIKTVYEQYKDKGLDVVSIAVWEREPVEVTIQTAAELGMEWNQINNGQREPAEIYGVEGIPHLILFGPDGTILKRGFHGLEGIQAAVSEYIK